MSEQERRINRQDQGDSGPESSGSNSDELVNRRQDGDDLLRAGDAIIEGLLSGNSLAFLQNNEQRGGQ